MVKHRTGFSADFITQRRKFLCMRHEVFVFPL